MYDCGKSDSAILSKKSANKGVDASASAEWMEERALAKGNSREQTRLRTQSRESLQNELARVRQMAAKDKEVKFTALWHHVYNVDRLREAFFGLKRKSAKGVDGETGVYTKARRSPKANRHTRSGGQNRPEFDRRSVECDL